MRIQNLLLVLLCLFLTPVPGDGGIVNVLKRHYCRLRGGRCALVNCLPREELIGQCSLAGRKCCRKRK
ncbi:beta-defensin 103A-like [Sorex araneus]|uniref:beta-defensin 103A-like n=1 Tax=Sorex araneus TaxID=42254 RepID=UPI0003317A46|nr:beta-defensin 103A-like [Sorex araneus]